MPGAGAAHAPGIVVTAHAQPAAGGGAAHRHLSNPRVLGPAAISGAEAWRALQRWLALPETALLPEPPGIDELLARWSAELPPRAGDWTDAYLAAFANAGGCRLVAFDGDFHRYPGVSILYIAPWCEAPSLTIAERPKTALPPSRRRHCRPSLSRHRRQLGGIHLRVHQS
ncbi:MAG TPA: PIN domain-containing protein [Gemmatimonadaceae bacterium]